MRPVLGALALSGVAIAPLLEPARSDPSPAYRLMDFGLASEGPTTLVVTTPGVGLAAYVPLAHGLEEAGFDAWIVSLVSRAPWPSEGAVTLATQRVLPEAVAELKRRKPEPAPWALVGHGCGGTLALLSSPHMVPHPDAVALLGAPLGPAPSEAVRWLADQTESPLVTVPNPDLRWNGSPILSLLWGDPVPPLEPQPTILHLECLGWLTDGVPLEPAAIQWPVLATAGALDRMVPPEAVFGPSQDLPRGRYVRFGMLHLDPTDPGHGALLQEPRFTAFVARWLEDTLK